MVKTLVCVFALILFGGFKGYGVGAAPKFGKQSTRQARRFKSLPPYQAAVNDPNIQHVENCNIGEALKAEIACYKDVVDQIVNEALKGSYKGRTYDDLQKFVDTFGGRVSGSQTLEDSIDYMMKEMKERGLENIHGEDVTVPHWFRGDERAELLTPRRKKIDILGLPPSVGTPNDGITAEVLVVRSFDDLKANAAKAKGKIVVFNQDWAGDYHKTVLYRVFGAYHASQYGGVASLVRSVTDFSLYTLHTGGMVYFDNVTKIPTASITVEDAMLLDRLQEAGSALTINLTMVDYDLPPAISRNVFGEITGADSPYEIVAVSGHIDSWDNGEGAMDDGGGMMISAEALYLLKSLNLRPRRTLQAILWTSEEFGYVGALAYVKAHENELLNFTAAFESDGGAFNAVGLEFAGTDEAGCIVYEILKLLEPYGMNEYVKHDFVGSDIELLEEVGVPGLSLKHDNDNYFWYHHTAADTMNVMDSDELDRCTAIWAAVSYVIADLTDPLPKSTSPKKLPLG